MKIVLVAMNAKYIHSNPAIYYLRGYVAAKDPAAAKEIALAEFTINQEQDEILRQLYLEKPDVLAFSCYIWNIDIIGTLLPEIHKIMPETDIWLGGPEVSFDAEKRMRDLPAIRGIMRGEGEETFYELVEFYFGKQPGGLSSICGITYREKGTETVLQNADRPYLDFDQVPFPYEDLDRMEHRIIYYETSRGCPFACSYCLSSVDRKVRLRDIETVKKELQFFLDQKVPQVKFVDRTFNCNPAHTKAIWEYIKEHDNGITNFHFEIAAELLREEEIELLAGLRSGLVQLEIGVQTVNPDTLMAICRKADMNKLSRIVTRLIHAGNMHIHLDLIAGLPFEDLNSFRHSFDEVYRLHPEQLQLGFLKVLKGSPMEKKSRDYGIQYKDKPPYEVLSTNWLSYRDILELKQVEEMLEVYYNSGQFLLTMRYLEHFYQNPYDLYLELAEFYEQQGLSGRKHNRLQRYEYIRQFFVKKQEEGWRTRKQKNAEVIETLLLYDLYAREKCKSRPEFAINREVEKNIYRDFFEKKCYESYLTGYDGYKPAQVSRMVHLEEVEIDPVQTAKTGETVEWKGYLLFDYQKIDRVTGNASCHLIPIEGSVER